MQPLSPAMATRCTAAISYVLDRCDQHAESAEIIAGLINHHGATRLFIAGTHVLRCGGIIAKNNANNSDQLLGSWRRNAVVRLSVMI